MKLFLAGARSPTGKALVENLRKRKIPFLAPAEKHFTPDNKSAIARMVGEYSPTQLVNLADFISGNHSALKRAQIMEDRCRAINAELPGILAGICNRLEVPLLHLSSSYVFNGEKKLAYGEHDEPDPIGVYGKCSLEGERRVQEIPAHIVLRPGWLFGPHKRGLIKSWIRSIKRHGGEIDVWRRRLSPTSTEDLAAAIVAICLQVDCEANVWGTYHYCGVTPSWEKQLAMLTLECSAALDENSYRLLDRVNLTEKPVRAPEVFNSTLLGKKLFDTFGIKPQSWEEQLKKTVQSLYDPAKKAAGKKGGKLNATGSAA